MSQIIFASVLRAASPAFLALRLSTPRKHQILAAATAKPCSKALIEPQTHCHSLQQNLAIEHGGPTCNTTSKRSKVLVPYTAEENAELSGGEDTVPPPLPPRRPPPRAASAGAGRAGRAAAAAALAADGSGRPRRDRRPTRRPGGGANAEAANRPITKGQPGRRPGVSVLLTLASVSWYVHGHGVLPDVPLYRLESQPIGGGSLNFAWRCGDRDDADGKSVFVNRHPTSSSASAQTTS